MVDVHIHNNYCVIVTVILCSHLLSIAQSYTCGVTGVFSHGSLLLYIQACTLLYTVRKHVV